MFEESIRHRIEEEGSEIMRALDEKKPLSADVLESSDEVMVLVDLPGCDKETIDLNFERGVLRIEAVREKPLEEGFRYVRETRNDLFEGKVPIPTKVVADEASATYDNGLLEVRLPKKTKDIEIE
ncbi:MAG: Hsp20/alpha crystallin family protein [Halobacteria archaeon]|nr:Hsp20/alpha crystallin family protein [Halobacteria archaeon]